MAIYRVQVTLDHDSALAEDQMVNTWHLSGDIGANPGLVTAEFIDFYGGASGAMQNTLFARFSEQLAGSGRVRIYDLADAKPRVPLIDDDFSGLVTGATALPAEIAACLSFKAAPAAGVNRARRRNRVYLGPLSLSALDDDSTPVIDPAFRSDMMIALQALKDGVEAATGNLCTLVGYSPTDGIPWTIAEAWCDDAPDIQRRRGKAPVARTTAAIA